MSWWGTLAGGAFGFMLGGPIGAVLGAALGRNFDRGVSGNFEQPGPGGGRTRSRRPDNLPRGHQFRIQAAFFTAIFSVMGHISKADGKVSKDEIRMATRIMEDMNLSPQQREAAKALFNEGKEDDFDIYAVLTQFRREIARRTTLQRMFVEILCYAAYADGVLHPEENHVLVLVCDEIGYSSYELESILASVSAELHHRQQRDGRISLGDAYGVLNIAESANDAEVKKAYRRLISQHHPDKLVAKGLPEEMMKIATQRTHEIRQAYERIKEHRRF